MPNKNGIGEKKLDRLFSEYIRKRGHCERCGKTNCRLECSHFYGRRNRSVRWSALNCSCLCNGCHRYFHEHPLEHTKWMAEKLGDERMQELIRMANTPVKANLAYREVVYEWLVEQMG